MSKLTDPLIQESIEELKQYIGLPSVSAKQQSIDETAEFLGNLLTEFGAKVDIWNDYKHPVVFAEAKPKKPSETTILIYNHYDVQPEEPVELWNSDPFELKITDDKFIGRGASDCKSDLISRITALKKYRQDHGDLPCNIKFLVEGEEEVASEHLAKYLEKYGDKLSADLVIWESGAKNEQEQFTFTGGNKGILCYELVATSSDIDLHSSFAAVVDSAAFRLSEAISALREKDGTIKVPGFYDDVVKPSKREEELVEKAVTPDLAKKWGLKVPLLNNKSVNYNLTFEPTINIEGISSGWEGEGVKTVTPKSATAKLEFRLVPNQDPKDIFDKLTKYLNDQGFKDIKVNYLLGEKGYRWDLDSPIVNKLISAAEDYYGGTDKVSALPSSAGTGPMYVVNKYTKAPIVSCGVSYAKGGAHAPNENIRIKDYLEFIDFFNEFLAKLN
ncbi:M20/M25/M40 family metallo-hydrolase (plasmid) [Companilactobacillus allii]|uniref:Acetylornithine deacetylase n=1 Tax=Companilactobacillus allii TaxID=1847728 RepID=A0A1P8Q607_9LACO|nr:M20/M25/M40 family metallo-hydrolase [Companilactobacillus allii]APX73271.1 acetylornithine deacetylase [Companilactobacillus allii]USQ68087.1 M20/M25/M40 family metallo-hydrolase [Companilactobacillus allii]USQ69935.1 M20/M25/M40 family metallo-hydrolase [Companilactobacillus allii]